MRSRQPARAASRGRCAWVAVGAAFLAAVLFTGGAAAQAQPQPAAVQTCVACHGAVGAARMPSMPSIAGQPRLFIENQLVLIREGLRDVPLMKSVMDGMSDEDIVALARHFAVEPAPQPAGLLQPDKARAGAQVSRQALCGTCHLPNYAGQNQVPRLAGQHEDYLALTLKMYRDKPAPGRDTAMSAVLQGMKDSDLADLAHYFAHYIAQ